MVRLRATKYHKVLRLFRNESTRRRASLTFSTVRADYVNYPLFINVPLLNISLLYLRIFLSLNGQLGEEEKNPINFNVFFFFYETNMEHTEYLPEIRTGKNNVTAYWGCVYNGESALLHRLCMTTT